MTDQRWRVLWILLGCVVTSLVLGILAGSVRVPIWHLFDTQVGKEAMILRYIRLPRVLMGFLIGGALGISGAAVQSSLNNPLASPYTMGVSAGASLGVSLYFLSGFNFFSIGIPAVGFLFGMGTVLFIMAFAKRVDPFMQNQTVILAGMVFSLFVNGVLTVILALSKETLEKTVHWQMGSLGANGFGELRLFLPFLLVGTVGILRRSRELDVMAMGDEQALSMGVDVPKVKRQVLIYASLLTGSAVAFTGAIGFIDLVVVHVIRKLIGSNHRFLLPYSFLFGGSFLVMTDLFARTVLSPRELPVGAITALIGAPFFMWVFFNRRRT